MTLTTKQFQTLHQQSEKQFEQSAKKLLRLYGYTIVRINTIKRGYFKSYHVDGKPSPHEGFPDLLCIKPPDRFILIETKSAKGKLRESQIEFMEYMNKRGFTNIYKASTINELETILKEAK